MPPQDRLAPFLPHQIAPKPFGGFPFPPPALLPAARRFRPPRHPRAIRRHPPYRTPHPPVPRLRNHRFPPLATRPAAPSLSGLVQLGRHLLPAVLGQREAGQSRNDLTRPGKGPLPEQFRRRARQLILLALRRQFSGLISRLGPLLTVPTVKIRSRALSLALAPCNRPPV